MNEQQAKWLDYYIESGDARKATQQVYTDVKGQSIATKTSYLKATLAAEIDNHAREKYKKETPLMLNVIKDLALNAKQDAVKLKAADTWLSRAGHDAAQVIEVKKTVTHEQLLDRLKIAATGIDPTLLAGILPNNIIKDITPKENKEDDITH